MTTNRELDTYAQNTWCPGCGNFGILTSIKKVLTDLQEDGLDLNNVVIVSGIGCHAKIVDYINLDWISSSSLVIVVMLYFLPSFKTLR